MSDLELQQLFDNTFDCYTYYEDDSMEEVKEPAMTKATFTAETFKLLRKQANDFRTENSKCAIPSVSNPVCPSCGTDDIIYRFKTSSFICHKCVDVEWANGC